MSCCKRSIIFSKLFHVLAISDSFFTFRDARKEVGIWGCNFISRFFLKSFLFALFRRKNIFHKLSIFFSFLKLTFPQGFLSSLFFFFLILLFFNLFKPHILFVLWNLMIDRLSSLLFGTSLALFHLNISTFMLFNLSEVHIKLLFDHFLFLLNLSGFMRDFFFLLQNFLLFFELLQKLIALLFDKLSFLSFSFLFLHPGLYPLPFLFFYSFLFLELSNFPFLFLLFEKLQSFFGLFSFSLLNLFSLLFQLLDKTFSMFCSFLVLLLFFSPFQCSILNSLSLDLSNLFI